MPQVYRFFSIKALYLIARLIASLIALSRYSTLLRFFREC
jgi:hypothetical protein